MKKVDQKKTSINIKIDDKLKEKVQDLDQAKYEADNHIFRGSYDSFEDYKKAMRK